MANPNINVNINITLSHNPHANDAAIAEIKRVVRELNAPEEPDEVGIEEMNRQYAAAAACAAHPILPVGHRYKVK